MSPAMTRAAWAGLLALAARCSADLIDPNPRHQRSDGAHHGLLELCGEAGDPQACLKEGGACRERCPDGTRDVGGSEDRDVGGGGSEDRAEGHRVWRRLMTSLPSSALQGVSSPKVDAAAAVPEEHEPRVGPSSAEAEPWHPVRRVAAARCCVPLRSCGENGFPCGLDEVCDGGACRKGRCSDIPGTCRAPVYDREHAEADPPACHAGEVAWVFERRCDSGCGYWRGRCGQTCCVPVEGVTKLEDSLLKKKKDESEQDDGRQSYHPNGRRERKLAALSDVGGDTDFYRSIAGAATLDSSEVACLAGVCVLALFLWTCVGPPGKFGAELGAEPAVAAL